MAEFGLAGIGEATLGLQLRHAVEPRRRRQFGLALRLDDARGQAHEVALAGVGHLHCHFRRQGALVEQGHLTFDQCQKHLGIQGVGGDQPLQGIGQRVVTHRAALLDFLDRFVPPAQADFAHQRLFDAVGNLTQGFKEGVERQHVSAFDRVVDKGAGERDVFVFGQHFRRRHTNRKTSSPKGVW